MEHPAAPWIEEAASIWRTEEVQTLLQHPKVQLFTFLQGLYGAASAKPTSFLAYNIPQLTDCMKKHMLPPAFRSAWMPLTGRESDGSWKTARAKMYPKAVNLALMEMFYLHVASLREHVQTTLIECPRFIADVATIRSAMEHSGRDMGPDCAR